jgi:hypothetical protein
VECAELRDESIPSPQSRSPGAADGTGDGGPRIPGMGAGIRLEADIAAGGHAPLPGYFFR